MNASNNVKTEDTAVYLVAVRKPGIDESQLSEYLRRGAATFEGTGMELLAAGPPSALEGAEFGKVVIGRFPSAQAARDWYDSDGYQAVIPLRHAVTGVEDLMIVEAIPN